jgi:hypothetical protein
MHGHHGSGLPRGPFGYQVCRGCGVAVQRRALKDHVCDPERYAERQASALHWDRGGFEDALRSWLQTPRGRFAQFYAGRMIRQRPAIGPGAA